jgi:hypothetical protein
LTVIHSPIGRRVKRQLNLLDILIGPSRDVLNWRPEVVDHIVVGGNVRDVPGLIDDLNVSLGRHDVPCVARFPPMGIVDKSVSCRANAIIRVGPGRDRLLRGDVSFGWKRSPADVLITLPPRDPGWRPLISGDPAPPGPADIDPPAIMVGRPAKTFLRVPVPTAIGPNPVSVLVRSPIAGYSWSETVTIIAGFDPVAFVGGQPGIKNVIVILIRCRNRLRLAKIWRLGWGRLRCGSRCPLIVARFRHCDKGGGQLVGGGSVANDPSSVIDVISDVQGIESAF